MAVPGYIYILSNDAFKDGFFKIGMTTRTPEERAFELYQGSTGVPGFFTVEFSKLVSDCALAERNIHQKLAEYRENKYREFFVMPIYEAQKIICEVCDEIDKENGYCPEPFENKNFRALIEDEFKELDNELDNGDIDFEEYKQRLRQIERKLVQFEISEKFTQNQPGIKKKQESIATSSRLPSPEEPRRIITNENQSINIQPKKKEKGFISEDGWVELLKTPPVIAGIINGIVVNVDKNILYESFIITLIIAVIATHISTGSQEPEEHLFMAIIVSVPYCILFSIIPMTVSGLIIHMILMAF